MIVKCEHCGKEFSRKSSLIKKHIFCSNKCRAEHWNNKVEITCKVCGKKFAWRASRLKYYRTDFCSKKCAGIARRNRITVICKGCGKTFEVRSSHKKGSDQKPRGVYCSKNCYTKHARGKNSHMYDHGQTFYPYCERFSNSLRKRVRKFFESKCVVCGIKKPENNNKNLDVHHIFVEKMACCETKIEEMEWVRSRLPKNIAKFGQPELTEIEIIYIRMMVPLCIRCHAKIHKLEPNDMPYKQTKYRRLFAELIMNKYKGKCFENEKEATANY